MTRSIILSLVLTLFLLFAISCSGNGGNVITPAPAHETLVNSTGGTVCQGLWQFTVSKDGSVDITQLRNADKIINVIGFMEPPALSLMNLDWDALDIDFDNGTIDVGVILTHPIPGDDVFTGFDVRGVCFGPRVSNADGLTIVPSPEFFSGVPFGYQDGLLGAPDSYANYEGLAGYKYYCDGLGPDDDMAEFFIDTDNLANRGSYGAGATNQRNYHLEWNSVDLDFLVFNYAIYANYNWPVGDAPIDLEDFDITTANSAEAFCASFTVLDGGFYYADGSGGGEISLQVEIWDWQGDITDVTLESPALGITETAYSSYVGAGGTAYSNIWEFDNIAGYPTSNGEVDLIVRAYDVTTFGAAWFLDLLPTDNVMYDEQLFNAFTLPVIVTECPAPTCESTDPPGGTGVLDDVTFYCTGLVEGSSLAIKLTDGVTDYVGTDVQFVSATEMTADFDLTGAATGSLDIEITNGCGSVGVGPATFAVATIVHHSTAPPGSGFIDIGTHVGTGNTTLDLAVQPDSEEVYVVVDGGSWSPDATDPNDGTSHLFSADLTAELGVIDLWVYNPTAYPHSRAEYKDVEIATGTNSTGGEGISMILWPAWNWYCDRAQYTDGVNTTNGGGTGYVGYGQPDVPMDAVNWGGAGANLGSSSFHAFYYYGSTDYRVVCSCTSTYTTYNSLGLANPSTYNFDNVYDTPSNFISLAGGPNNGVLWGLFENASFIRPYNSTITGWGAGTAFGTSADVVNPVDITMDKSTGILYVLDSPSGTDYRITGWDPSTQSIVAGSGPLSDASGVPYALDYSETGDCMYVLFDDNTISVYKDIANT